MSLQGKTLFITGASRGIGKAIALRAAQEGANIVIAAKTDQPHPKLPGTIHTAATEIEEAGGKALAVKVDIRFEDQVQQAVEQAVTTFGGIDIVINNASAIHLSTCQHTPIKKYDLMQQVNTRGTYITTQACLPHLLKSQNPHVLTLSPPISMQPRWFSQHTAYTISKYGMSLVVFGLAAEFKAYGIAVNALWPKTTIATSAIENVLGGQKAMKLCRTPQIMADAAIHILSQPSQQTSGNFFIDEEVLRKQGVTDFRHYQVDPDLASEKLLPDLFVG